MTEAAMSNEKLRYVILYTAGIALLVFIINYVVLKANMQSTLMWTGLFAAIAFAMAWRQATQKKL
ncbi:MAG TPA: hypothetical protein VFO35_04455 [Steroidobacteraceae bacterium]|nr:hypothetical protein [Steroidobacteraceae bacterium]